MSIYSDINSVTPSSKALLLDIQSVYQSLNNLFNTRPTERLFLPLFGFELESELFEIIDDITAVSIYNRVVEAIERWETRVVIDNSRTTITPIPDENKYDLDLYFAIQGVEGQAFVYRQSFTK